MSLDRIRGMSDVDALARIIEAEAASEPLAGKVAVGAVIDNRRRSGQYGEGWKGVITRPGQFSAINDVTGYARGQGANKIFWREPGEESRAVAQAIVSGKYKDPTGGATHYFNPQAANPKWKNDTFRPIGNHVFGQADAGRVSGGGESVTLTGGSDTDELRSEMVLEAVRRGLISKSELEAEASRRGLLGDQAQRVAAEGPSQQDRADVEHALGQLEAEGAPEKKGMIEGVFDEFTSGVVGNFGDELEAIERAIPALFNDENFVEEYQVALSEGREASQQFSDENPIASTAANIAGAMGAGVGLARRGVTLANSTRSVAGATGVGALEGGIYGAIYGAGAAEGDEVIAEALESGAVGGLLGGVLSGTVQKIANGRARAQAVRALKPTADLKAARDAAYDTVSRLGLTYRTQAIDNLIGNLSSRVNGQAFNEKLHTGTAAAIKYAETLRGKNLSMTQLDQLRQVIARDAGGSTVPADKTFAADMIEEIDNFIATTSPRGSASAGPGPGKRAILEARRAHATFRKSETIERLLIEAADAAAATGSGGNINNQIRQRLKNLLKSKKQRRGFNNEELGIMRRIVRGNSKENTLRLIGKLSPSGNGLMMALNIGAIATNPAMAVGTVAGTAAKELADRGTQRAVTGLQGVIQGHPLSPTANMTAQKRALLRALAVDLGVDLTVEGSTPRTTPGQQPGRNTRDRP